MTTSETAKRLGVDQQVVYRLIDSGELPAAAIGRVYFVCAKDVEVMIAGAPFDDGVVSGHGARHGSRSHAG